jgi:small subunit ribosomal protein S1
MVEEINEAERRITLGPGDAVDENEWRQFTQEEKKPIGSLGEKLQKALESKNEGK